MFILLTAAGMTASYYLLIALYTLFFTGAPPKKSQSSLASAVIIFLASIAISLIAYSIPDEELSNRVLHAFAGGFMAFLVCFMAVCDARLSIGKFQFFVLSFLIVMTLGIANEVFEFILQNYTPISIVFAETINDTWLDLVSNIVGTLVAAACFVPFLPRR